MAPKTGRRTGFFVTHICVSIRLLNQPNGCAEEMSRFGALREKYTLPSNVEQGRAEALRSAVQGIYENLVLFLEIPTWSFTDLDGQQMPYISVGRLEGGEFRLGTVEDLVVGLNGMNFSINVVIDEAVDQFPKAHIHFSFTVNEQNGELTVISHSAASGPAVFTGDDFTPISQHLYEVMRGELAVFQGSSVSIAATDCA
ncbi:MULTISPECIES: hypothetical protein [Pseudomonas]|uniref:hypothetical protein n=1 Tax=Pseudomonas TaxID=286 RepID=UPI0011155292|nr:MULTISPECIES: hypothetical protein [Pseudomonas]